MNRQAPDLSPDLLRYKEILARVIEQRPSGIRRRLADALQKNPSFISQIASPAYATPIPPADVQVIFEICHFSAQDRNAFVKAYRAAHPRRSQRLFADIRTQQRELVLHVPDWADAARNAEFDDLVRQFAKRIALFASQTPADGDDK